MVHRNQWRNKLDINIQIYSSPPFSLGIHLDWQNNQVWLFLIHPIIQINGVPHKTVTDGPPDTEKLLRSLGPFSLLLHTQPNDNTKFFNLGIRRGIVFVGRYRLRYRGNR